jgi:N-acetyl-anhydromuramyl-L-alanine amidase AmpD
MNEMNKHRKSILFFFHLGLSSLLILSCGNEKAKDTEADSLEKTEQIATSTVDFNQNAEMRETESTEEAQGQESDNIIPKGIVVHSMAEYILLPEGPKSAGDFLRSIGLSVHGFIHPDGRFEKMVDVPGRALHAGKSRYGELDNLNDHFLGFELLVKGEHNFETYSQAIEKVGTYSEEQFKTAVQICKQWMEAYDIPLEAVVRHSDISGDDVRGAGRGKTDPGPAFNWIKFKEALSE